MKRTFATLFMTAALALSASATVKPIHKLFPVKQSDGTSVMLYRNGAGHHAFFTTADNQVVVRNADGMLCYAELKDGKLQASSIRVHNIEERSAEELAFIAANTMTIAEAAKIDAANNAGGPRLSPRLAGNASTTDGLGKYNTKSGGAVPSIGELTVPVVMVEFSDKKFRSTTTPEKMDRYFNQEGYHEDNSYQKGSVRDYFLSQSNGMFSPTFKIVAKVTLDNGYAYYGKDQYDSEGNRTRTDVNVSKMYTEAIQKAVDQGVDFSEYYVNGYVPNISFLYAGYGEATGGDDDTLWPHELDLGGWYIKYRTYSGYNFGSYFVGNELYGASGSQIMGMGVFCHEFSHALGLPDFYVTDYSHDVSPFGEWSVMDEGEHHDMGYYPIGYNAYEKSYMGWLNIPTLSSDEVTTLSNPSDGDSNYAAIIRNPSDSKEYFILENRQSGTWYPGDMGTGLLICRYAYNSTAWTNNNLNNDQNHLRARIVTADGLASGSDMSKLFGNNIFAKTSFTLYNTTELTSTPLYMIAKHADGTITFNYKNRDLSNPSTEGTIYYKVTDASQLAKNDKIVIVSKASNVALGKNGSSARGAIDVAFDSDDNIIVNDDVQVLTLAQSTNGQYWGFNTGSGYLSVTGTGVNLHTQAKGDANAFATIDIVDGNAVVKFQNTKNKNRQLAFSADDSFFAGDKDGSEIQIYSEKYHEPTGIVSIESGKVNNANDAIYNLAGQRVSKDYKGVVIMNGRKVVLK